MFASFRRYIRSSANPTGRSGLWFLYGIAVVVVWLVGRLSRLVRYTMKNLAHWTFSGSVFAILVKMTAAMIVISYLAALVGAQVLAVSLAKLTFLPLFIIGFWMVKRYAL